MSSNPMYGKVFFLAAARASDKVIVASLSYNSKEIEISAVRQMLASLQGTATGQLYAFSIANNMWTVMELGGILYVMATAIDYPQAVAAQCLQETNRLFVARVQETWKTCKEGGISDAAKKVLMGLCEKYDNLEAMDKVAATLAKVDAVKLTMQANISKALENCVMLEKIENDAADLQASAGIFRQQAKNLKSKMWWKKLKMNLCIAAVVLTITGAITLIICFYAGVFEPSDDDGSSSSSSSTTTSSPTPSPVASTSRRFLLHGQQQQQASFLGILSAAVSALR